MDILYISHLSGAQFAGPTYSVPKQIEAQSKLDNVFWYNASKSIKEEWKEYSFYHDIEECPTERISDLPKPFDKPDLIVVEQFYNMAKSPLLKELINHNHPYVIIPRGELTKEAQNRKKLKKSIANTIVFKRFANKALAIQYLTEQEQMDSGSRWNQNSIIVPNGVEMPNKRKASFLDYGIKIVSIGRIEPYQKGLDMLIEACSQIKEVLVSERCLISIYGPDREKKLGSLRETVNKEGLADIIHFHDGVYGKEKEEILLSNDVFIIPSRFEGHPMALIEALSYGLPCIATTGSNMSKEIQTANAGWVAETDVEGLIDALLSMIKEKDTLTMKTHNCIDLAQQYSWDIIALSCHACYIDLLKSDK